MKHAHKVTEKHTTIQDDTGNTMEGRKISSTFMRV